MQVYKIEDSQQQVGFEITSPMPMNKLRKVGDARVGFANVIIREYEVALGDNPSVSQGPPLSLGWSYNEMSPVDLEKYEEMRGIRRETYQMAVPVSARVAILVKEWGFSTEEVEQTSRQCQKVKKGRMNSARQVTSPIHIMVKNAKETVGNVICRRKDSQQDF
mmetsp:Transcript_49606/g.57922  ORF Transcript_49606/g.57922 Transcript_49606/m.57922 type:complete len:163 (+) Transcript_49606:129-617(+)